MFDLLFTVKEKYGKQVLNLIIGEGFKPYEGRPITFALTKQVDIAMMVFSKEE
jgi:hypothetical protein